MACFIRGYYRCSSSRGCPARKQVERSRDDPTMLVITYSCEHNHPWPAPRNSHHHHNNNNHQNAAATAADDAPSKPEMEISTPDPEPEQVLEPEAEAEPEPTDKPTSVKVEPSLMPADDEFGWFTGMDTMTSSLLESPLFDSKMVGADTDMALFFPMREEDDSLFADLGELPECSVVLRHRDVGTQVQIC